MFNKSVNFKRKLIEKILFFKQEFSNFVANWWNGRYENIQNFSSISLKFCLLGQKNTGTWAVNTPIAVLGNLICVKIHCVYHTLHRYCK